MVVAAAMEDRAAARSHPADQRPAGDLCLGDEAGGALRMEQFDVQPRGVVGHEQHGIGQGRAETPAAEAEHAQQHGGPHADGAMGQRFAAVLHHPAGPAQDQRADHDAEHDMEHQQGHPPEIAKRTHAVAGGRVGGGGFHRAHKINDGRSLPLGEVVFILKTRGVATCYVRTLPRGKAVEAFTVLRTKLVLTSATPAALSRRSSRKREKPSRSAT